MVATSTQTRQDEHQELLDRARGGDTEAFCQLAGEHEVRLFNQALALCGDREEAEDLAGETLLEAWKSLSRYEGACRFSTWLYGILWHRYQKSVRRKRSRPVSLAQLPCDEARSREDQCAHLSSPDVSPAEQVLQDELAQGLRMLLDRLPAKHRQVLTLRFFGELSIEETASVTGCSVGTVKSRLHHGLEKLRLLAVKLNLLEQVRDT